MLIAALEFVVGKVPYFALGAVLLFVGKLVYDLTTPYLLKEQITGVGNSAVSLALAGYLLGLALALSGALLGVGDDLVPEVINILIVGCLAIVLLRISGFLNDKLVLYTFSTTKEMVEDRNAGTGFVVGAMTLSTGLMISGVMLGSSSSVLTMIRDVAVYWALGQVILILDGLVFQLITPFDVHAEIGDHDNTAAGITFAGFLVAQGIVVRTALAGAGSDLLPEMLIAVVIAVCGLLLLVLGRYVADWVFLPGAPLGEEIASKKNVAAAIVAAVSFITLALLFAAATDASVPNAGPVMAEALQ